MSALTTSSIRWAVECLNADARRLADELNTLDGTVGDGDLGVTLARGAERMAAGADQLPADVGQALLQCGMAFTKVAASTYGTLLATGLMAAARLTRGREAVPWAETGALLGAAVSAMQARGKSALGDKTVLDAVEAVRQACEGLEEPAAMLDAAAAAVRSAIGQLRDQPFRQGRARIFAISAAGKDDPGMVAFLRIIECLARHFEQTTAQ